MAYITVKIITVYGVGSKLKEEGGEGLDLSKILTSQKKKKRSLVMAMFNFAKKIAEPLKKSKKSKIFYQWSALDKIRRQFLCM